MGLYIVSGETVGNFNRGRNASLDATKFIPRRVLHPSRIVYVVKYYFRDDPRGTIQISRPLTARIINFARSLPLHPASAVSPHSPVRLLVRHPLSQLFSPSSGTLPDDPWRSRPIKAEITLGPDPLRLRGGQYRRRGKRPGWTGVTRGTTWNQ